MIPRSDLGYGLILTVTQASSGNPYFITDNGDDTDKIENNHPRKITFLHTQTFNILSNKPDYSHIDRHDIDIE